MPIQQIEANFIGRQRETKIFKQWLLQSDASSILYFHDALEEQSKKGGAGKTWLLRRCMTIAKTLQPDLAIVLIDFFDVSARDGITITEHVVKELAKIFPDWSTDNFNQALESYHTDSSNENSDGSDLRSELAKALSTDMDSLNRQLLTKKKRLLLFFDTFELIERTPTIAVLSFASMFPDTYQFDSIGVIIASRNKVDWSHPNWQGREAEVKEVPISPFSQQEMVEYLDRESIYDKDYYLKQMEELYDRTEGRPILIGLVADVLNRRVINVDDLIVVNHADFESYLVMQIQRLEDPLNWVILFMAHVYHRFNSTILHWILTESSLQEVVKEGSSSKIAQEHLIDILPTLSFVRSAGTGDDLVLHDEMRRLVTKYCWGTHDPDHLLRKDVSQCVINHYEQKLEQPLSEQEQQLYKIEITYHTLFLNIDAGLEYFDKQFSAAIGLSKRAFARTLLQEVLLFNAEMSLTQQRDLLLSEARLQRIEEKAVEALNIYQQLKLTADPDWLEKHRALILWEEGLCHTEHSDLIEAIRCFEDCLQLERAKGNTAQEGIVLNKLGYAYRTRGQYDIAQRCYQEALTLYAKLDNQSEYANMINNLSFIDKQRGKTQLALHRCQIGLHIRKSLFLAGKASEFPIALSLSNMGQIYLDGGHTMWSRKCFDDAFKIYNRWGRRRELAATYNRFGQVEMAQGEYELARSWLEKAQETSIGINTEAYINSLNKQGRLLTLEKKWEEALPFFEMAIKQTQKIRDDYQQVENLIDIAKALYRLDQKDLAGQRLQEASDQADARNYYDLQGQIEEFRGDIRFEIGNYKEAFIHYRQLCRFMALRSEVEYEKAHSTLIDRLFDTPQNETSEIIDDFMAYWSKEMGSSYPELIGTLEDVKKGKFLENLPGGENSFFV